ncbi:MAG: hypothetical protein WC824_07980 [Bacteroidota bacterium]|jgi:hypothetical protein
MEESPKKGTEKVPPYEYDFGDVNSIPKIEVGKTEVTIKTWDTEGKILCDWTFGLEKFNITQNKPIEPIYGLDGKIGKWLIGQVSIEISGKIVDPDHSTFPFEDVVKSFVPTEEMKACSTKSVEELEQEMVDWVSGNKDAHDEIIESLKKQSLQNVQKKIDQLETEKKAMLDRYNSAIWKEKILSRHTNPDPGVLKVEEGKIVATEKTPEKAPEKRKDAGT